MPAWVLLPAPPVSRGGSSARRHPFLDPWPASHLPRSGAWPRLDAALVSDADFIAEVEAAAGFTLA
jgi:hypothetical protein